MKLYLLENLKNFGYDVCLAHVVRAESEEQARSLCKNHDEGDIWRDPDKTSCTEISLDAPPELILTQTLDG